MLKTSTLICTLMLVVLTGCDLPHEPGPMPTDIVETRFEPGLNILGVLRADGIQGSSFMNINRALTTEEIYSDTILNFSPDVEYVQVLSHRDSSVTYFTRSNVNPQDWDDYVNRDLYARSGVTYELEIKAPGFPVLTGETTIPHLPWILNSSWEREVGLMQFAIDHDPTAFEYKLYLYFGTSMLEKIVKPVNGDSTLVRWNYPASLGEPTLLMVTALDENLTRYGNSPISFIPNTYHADASTVEGGYGCFGSVAVSLYEFE